MNKIFDRLADLVGDQVSRAWFFVFCLLIVIAWAPSFLLIGNIDTWQLVINTTTTIITFLLVALLHNTEFRNEKALHQKLDLMLEAMSKQCRDPKLKEKMQSMMGTEAAER